MKISRVFLTSFLSAALWAALASAQDKLEAPASPAAPVAEGETPAEKKAAAPPAEKPAVEPSSLPGMERRKPSPVKEAAAEKPMEKPASPPGGTYVVEKGDNLWNLAGTYYKDPFRWRRIWEANRSEIENPDLIYPLQRFAIPGVTMPSAEAEEAPEEAAEAEEPEEEAAGAEAEAEAETEEEAAEEPEAAAAVEEAALVAGPKVKLVLTRTAGTYVAPEDWEGDGHIIGDRDKNIMISQNDIVYLNIGAANGVKPRMRAQIYRKGRKVWDPATGQRTGLLVRRVGLVEVTKEVGDETATAVVLTSYEPLQIGDVVKLEE